MFNLIDEHWLVLRGRDGESVEVSLLEAVLDAERYEEPVVYLPTQTPALFRQLFLPVVVAALGAPANEREWADRFWAGRFSDAERKKIGDYLDKHRDRFELFHPHTPFAQVGGLRTAKDETKGAALLVATAATGNNVPLFAARSEADPLPLTPAKAAHWLLHTHCWDTAAIKTGAADDPKAKAGKTTGNPTGPLGQLGVVMPIGTNLYETLMLNLPIGPPGGRGRPHWERDPADSTWDSFDPPGILDLWTWQSRRIRLIPEQTPDGVRVTRVVVCAGDRIRSLPEWEPHTTWNFRKVSKKASERKPRRHQPGKAIWRGLDAFLTLEPPHQGENGPETSLLLRQIGDLQDRLPEGYPLRVATFGMVYGNQSAVVEDVIHDAMPLAVAALKPGSLPYDVLLDVTRQAEELAQAVNRLSDDLRKAIGADPIPWDKGQRPGERVLHALDPLVRRVLLGVRREADDHERLEEGQLAWERVAWTKTWQIVDALFAALPAGSFRGRKTTQDNGTTVTYRPGAADERFRRRLAAILPRAAEFHRQAAAARRAAHADPEP
ncbi:type I-E CRISPR-associated protein Cse1/CasA [Actinomadura kijaniata]|uniref:type I-E CRISPR-associated protein Cse1/CasA n=1 Tax=Actinomadura kijaniata TaxID=46161 RepID=UPI003F19874A